MRLFLLLPLLLLASGLLTTCVTAQDDAYLVPPPASVDSSQNAYYTPSREPPRQATNLELYRPPASRISAVMPPVDLITREQAANGQSEVTRVTPAQASISVDEQRLPTFANDRQLNSNANDPAFIQVAEPKTVWPAQTSPFPVNASLQQPNHPSQSQNQVVTLPSATSNADEYYVPTMPVAATKTLPSHNALSHHRPIQPAAGDSKSAGHTSSCCDEWRDFWPCKHPDFDAPCSGTSGNCGGRANCKCAGKRKHADKGCGAGCGAQGACDDATGNECNSAQCDGSCKGKPKRRFSVFTININR